jgi:hypothetical protein
LCFFASCREGHTQRKDIYNPKTIKENTVKNLIKIAIVSSFLIITCLLIGACGGGTEQLARNQGDVAITVTNNIGGAALAGVLVEVRQTQGSGTFTSVGTTPVSGQLTFTGTAGTNYYFQFSKAGFTTQTDIMRTPQLTSTVPLVVTM